MGHLITIDPRDVSVIDAGDLKHPVHSWITGAALASGVAAINEPPITRKAASTEISFICLA